jgi:death-on-curing protein
MPANGERPPGASEDTEVYYLTANQVLGLYADILGCTNQQAADQLRSSEGLESALARPQFYAYYEDADIAMQAAVLTHGIAETQPFIDGNKRTALASMLTFFAVNGFDVTAAEEDCAQWILDLSAGCSAAELAERLRAVLVPLNE